MTKCLLPTTRTKDDALKKIANYCNQLTVTKDLDPDKDMVCGTDDFTSIINKNDCQLDDEIIKNGKLELIGGPDLIKGHDDGKMFEDLLEKLNKPLIEPPQNGKFTKEYLFGFLNEYCGLIVDDQKVFIKIPPQHHHDCVRNAAELETILKKVLEECGVADAQTLRKRITPRKCKELYHLCITDFRAIERAINFTNDGNYIAAANYIVHVVDGKIELLSYEDHPNLCFRHSINANYNPDSRGDAWDSFLSDYIGNKDEDVQRFWETEGSLYFSNHAPKTVIVHYGTGNDGKSVMGNFRRKIVEPNGAVFDADIGQALSQFGTEAFKDAQILQLHEMNGEVSLNQANKIKRITGGDRIMVDKKLFSLFDYLVKTKIIVTCNHLPRFALGTLDQALENRFQFIKVSAAPPEYRTASLIDDLFEQRDYYLTCAVQGYARLQKNKYKFTKSVKDSALKKTVFSTNPAKAFVKDCCDTKNVTSENYILVEDWKIVVKVWKQEICEDFTYKTLKWALVNLGYPFIKLTRGDDRNRYAFIGLCFNEYSLNILNEYKESRKGGVGDDNISS